MPETEAPWTPSIATVTLPDGYVIRQLAPEEWHRVNESGCPTTVDLPADAVAVVIAVISPDNRVCGHVLLTLNVMAEHLFFHESIRHHGKLGMAFLGAFITALRAEGVPRCYAFSDPTNPDAKARLLQLGFDPMSMNVHRADFTPKKESL